MIKFSDSKRKILSKGGEIVSSRFVSVEEKDRPIETNTIDCDIGVGN